MVRTCLRASLFQNSSAYKFALALKNKGVNPDNPVMTELQGCKNMNDVRKVCLEDHDYILLFVQVFGEGSLPKELRNHPEEVYFDIEPIEDDSDTPRDWTSDPQ